MTFKQKVLQWMYPWIVKLNKKNNFGLVLENKQKARPLQSFYDLQDFKNNGEPVDLSMYKGKKVLIVNTASNCGFTQQYDSLQKLYEQHIQDLVVLGFPSNDFKEQEKSSDTEIGQFCQINFGVSFPLMKKSVVLKQQDQNKVYKWLSDPALNGWNAQPPVWNFTKYLIDEQGQLTHVFGPSVEPSDAAFQKYIKM